MRIVKPNDGQVLRTRTFTRLIREDKFNLDEFRKFKAATHESSANCKERSYDQMLFKDLFQKVLLQQRRKVRYESVESDSQVIHSSGLLP